jgi:hypothetical protein
MIAGFWMGKKLRIKARCQLDAWAVAHKFEDPGISETLAG